MPASSRTSTHAACGPRSPACIKTAVKSGTAKSRRGQFSCPPTLVGSQSGISRKRQHIQRGRAAGCSNAGLVLRGSRLACSVPCAVLFLSAAVKVTLPCLSVADLDSRLFGSGVVGIGWGGRARTIPRSGWRRSAFGGQLGAAMTPMPVNGDGSSFTRCRCCCVRGRKEQDDSYRPARGGGAGPAEQPAVSSQQDGCWRLVFVQTQPPE